MSVHGLLNVEHGNCKVSNVQRSTQLGISKIPSSESNDQLCQSALFLSTERQFFKCTEGEHTKSGSTCQQGAWILKRPREPCRHPAVRQQVQLP